jgi:hypothetical protein
MECWGCFCMFFSAYLGTIRQIQLALQACILPFLNLQYLPDSGVQHSMSFQQLWAGLRALVSRSYGTPL